MFEPGRKREGIIAFWLLKRLILQAFPALFSFVKVLTLG
jgi:hypothetical protein